MLHCRCLKLELLVGFLGLALWSGIAQAGDDKPTLSASGQVFYATSKSGLAQSNDTGLMMNYGLHVFAGDNKNLSVHMEGFQSDFSYALNKATKSASELSFLLRAYFGVFYVGAGGGTTQVLIKRADGAKVDAFGTLYAGNLGARFEFGRDTVVSLDARGVLPTGIKEATQQDLKLGLKLDGKVILAFDLTRRVLDLETGVLYSTQEATFAGAGDGETMIAPFLGFSLNTAF
jgi:hypothetical protein